MGVLGDVIRVGLNGHSVDESSKRWLGDVFTVGFNGPSVHDFSMQLLGDVITEGLEVPSLEPSSVVISYIQYIYNLLVHMWECG